MICWEVEIPLEKSQLSGNYCNFNAMKNALIILICFCTSVALAQSDHEGHNHGPGGHPKDPHAGHSHLPGDKEALEHEANLDKEATVNSDTMITIGSITRPARKYFGNGKLKEESYYLDDKSQAVTKWYYMDGNISAEYQYKDGKIHGLQKTYYLNNKKKSENYWAEDVQNGGYKKFYENGTLKEDGEFVKGKKSGVWKSYHEDGTLASKKKYKNGVELK